QEILSTYEKLRELLPAAFDVAEERDRREPIVLHALIAQVPSMTSLDVHRLYGAGAMSLPVLLRADAAELSVVTGIARDRCAAILERVQGYRRERAEHPPGERAQAERTQVRELL